LESSASSNWADRTQYYEERLNKIKESLDTYEETLWNKYPNVDFVEDLPFTQVYVTFNKIEDWKKAKLLFKEHENVDFKSSNKVYAKGKLTNPNNILWENIEITSC